MCLKKIISKGVAIGLLLNGTLSSLAGALSEDGRYETFEGSKITIDNILEEDKVDVEIKGSTMVNSIGVLPNNTFYCDSSSSKATFMNSSIKENTTYTVFYNITKNTLTKTDSSANNRIAKLNLNNYNEYNVGYIAINQGDLGMFSKVITTSTETITQPYIETSPDAEFLSGGEFEIKDIMAIEGDYSNINMDYFQGIQSSFENNLITQEMIDNGEEKQENLGKYKVEIKSTGKNKFDGISAIEGFNVDSNGVLSATNTASDGRVWGYDYSQYFLRLNKGAYTITLNTITPATSHHAVIHVFNVNNEIISSFQNDRLTSVGVHSNVLTLDTDMTIGIEAKFFDGTYTLQIEEGSVATEYEPYRESINTFYLNSPLLEGDTIEYINGQATHVKRYGQVTLDGNTLYTPHRSSLKDSIGYRWIIWQDDSVGNFTSVEKYTFNNRYNNVSAYDSWEGIEEGISQNSSQNLILLYLERYSDGSEDSKQSLINELQDNPVTVLYKLANPIYEPIKADLSVQLFEGTTYISSNSNIPANMKVIIDRTINRATEATELAKANPTIENISQARMWTNLLKESTLKDEINNQINDITQIVDLQIEKQTISANMDVYVKSQNGLSMSLSTNSIVFDEFSGVEDMEKLNAINITVNSSLPYQLNSYLESELKNNDSSKVMPKELLNIRLNGEDDYKAFNNINEKLVLKENCEKGNDNIFGIDLILKGDLTHKADVYKTTIKFEAEQK